VTFVATNPVRPATVLGIVASDERSTFPLAISLERKAFEPPCNAIGWRVRRVQRGWKGFDVVTVANPHIRKQVPLVLHLSATRRDLARAVEAQSGLYRLDPIDEQGRVLAWTPAYIPVQDEGRVYSTDPEQSRYRVVFFSPSQAR
jgi:hypothetical protein